jgi:EAL domain-containing protein (putative c-di-GMP-specific phosphodiesterase class I)/ActR/RegA family two-component response regulator
MIEKAQETIPPIRVLIADDQADVREALAAVIRSDSGLQLVGAASDAPEAIALAADERPDVAVIDVKMPGGGGARAAREIRRLAPKTQILAFSAYSDRKTVFELLQAGATGYLVKGTNPADLLAGIHKAADGVALVSPEIASEVVGELSQRLRRQSDNETKRHQMKLLLSEAIDGTALRMVYQPIVELASLSVIGREALSRFALEPQRGPDEWFGEAASVGMLRAMELTAIRHAFADLGGVSGDGFLAVNASPETLMSADFERAVADRGQVIVEVTEHAPVEDYAALTAVVDRLRERGVRLAVDDAGAGFASLRHILLVKPDFIKLDISLTRGIDSDQGKKALAAGLISFAGGSGAEIIAEGIETEAELATMQELGARYGQGYLLGRPAPLSTEGFKTGAAAAPS